MNGPICKSCTDITYLQHLVITYFENLVDEVITRSTTVESIIRISCISQRFQILRFAEHFRKLQFRDMLVWTVGLTVERKLRF